VESVLGTIFGTELLIGDFEHFVFKILCSYVTVQHRSVDYKVVLVNLCFNLSDFSLKLELYNLLY